MHEKIGLISGLLVIISIIPYGIGAYRRTITPNVVSWSIWGIIGLALLLTYKSSGAKANIWTAVFGFTNPVIIAIIAIWRGKREHPNMMEVVCAIIGIMTLVGWCFVYDNHKLATYALCLALVADTFAAVPTVLFVWRTPDGDRPFAWLMFAFASGLNMFAIEEQTFANYVLPVYMTFASSSIALPLILYRIKERKPILQWI